VIVPEIQELKLHVERGQHHSGKAIGSVTVTVLKKEIEN
jgi:hypothetical protein